MFRRGGNRGTPGVGFLVSMISVLFLGYFALNLLSAFAPTIGNLTIEGEGMGATIFALVVDWFIPLAVVGIGIYLVRKLLGGR